MKNIAVLSLMLLSAGAHLANAREPASVSPLKAELAAQIVASFGVFGIMDLDDEEQLKEIFGDAAEKAAACSILGGASGSIKAYLSLARTSPGVFTGPELADVAKLDEIKSFPKRLCGGEENDFAELKEAVALAKQALSHLR